MLETTIAGSLPKPAWLAEPEKLWAAWRHEGAELERAKRDAALVWLNEQKAAGIDIVYDGEHFRVYFVHGLLEFYFGKGKGERRDRVAELLALIELAPEFAQRYPAELSGGQKQRVCIARALAAAPDLIICDEVTSALDPLVADGILKLLLRIQQETHVSYLFITHDLATVKAIAHAIVVMYQGRVVEQGPKHEILTPPHDAYTDLLLKSVPEMEVGWLEQVLETRRMAAAGH